MQQYHEAQLVCNSQQPSQHIHPMSHQQTLNLIKKQLHRVQPVWIVSWIRKDEKRETEFIRIIVYKIKNLSRFLSLFQIFLPPLFCYLLSDIFNLFILPLSQVSSFLIIINNSKYLHIDEVERMITAGYLIVAAQCPPGWFQSNPCRIFGF